MKVIIDDDFYVIIDAYNYTLYNKFKAEQKDGSFKDSVRTIGYYTNMEHVLNNVIKEKIANKEETINLKEYLQEYRIIAEYVQDRMRTPEIQKEWRLPKGE